MLLLKNRFEVFLFPTSQKKKRFRKSGKEGVWKKAREQDLGERERNVK